MAKPDPKVVYEHLVRRHGADLYRYAYRLAGERAAAEDLVQEAYYHAWRSIGSLRDEDAGRAWLLTILRRRWTHRLRDEGRRPALATGGEDVDDTASPLPGPDLDLLARRESVQAALDRLDPRFKDAFLLVFLEGLSCREAAGRLSIPLGTLLSRVHRARVALRAHLRDSSVERHADPDSSSSASGGHP